MQISIVLFLLTSFLLAPLFSQAQHENSPGIVWRKCLALYKQGKLDSIEVRVAHFRDSYNLYDSIRKFYIYSDTLRYSDGCFGVGRIILDPYMEFDGAQIGSWVYYFPTGKIFSKGDYQVGAYTICQFAGPNAMGYSFKVGQWNYWHDNGQLITAGVYRPEKIPTKTTCEMDTMYMSKAKSTWTYYDSLGKPLLNKEPVILKINGSF